jgi:hypothetical protein
MDYLTEFGFLGESMLQIRNHGHRPGSLFYSRCCCAVSRMDYLTEFGFPRRIDVANKKPQAVALVPIFIPRQSSTFSIKYRTTPK